MRPSLRGITNEPLYGESKMSSNATWTIIVRMFLGFILLTAVLLTWVSNRHVEEMAKLGYQETILPGSSFTYWRKSE